MPFAPMNSALLISDKRGFLSKLIEDLLRCGWMIESIPEDGKIPRNGMKLVLKADDTEIRLRVFAYKVTSSGRNRPHERRVEITTTYKSGLKTIKRFGDIVFGVDVTTGKYVGIDSKRLRLGGTTHNASSFFDLEGLSVRRGRLLINPRSVTNRLFPTGIELHAFFDRSRLSEYLFNQREIHLGLYAFGGVFSGPIPGKRISRAATSGCYKASGDAFVLNLAIKSHREKILPDLITAVEEKDFTKIAKKNISPEQLEQILSICDEIGALGEQAVLAAERKRLRRLGFHTQASNVERVSLRSVGEGYDIVSFEDDGKTKRYLEVKATTGNSPIVDVSRGEWSAAARLGRQYYLVRVTQAKKSPKIFFIRDPVKLERDGLVSRTATGWKIDLRLVMKSAR